MVSGPRSVTAALVLSFVLHAAAVVTLRALGLGRPPVSLLATPLPPLVVDLIEPVVVAAPRALLDGPIQALPREPAPRARREATVAEIPRPPEPEVGRVLPVEPPRRPALDVAAAGDAALDAPGPIATASVPARPPSWPAETTAPPAVPTPPFPPPRAAAPEAGMAARPSGERVPAEVVNAGTAARPSAAIIPPAASGPLPAPPAAAGGRGRGEGGMGIGGSEASRAVAGSGEVPRGAGVDWGSSPAGPAGVAALTGNRGAPVPPEYDGYVRALRRRIQDRLVYPWLAVRQRLNGVVELELGVSPDGRLARVSVVGGTGAETLREAAVKAVRDATPFPFPAGVGARPLTIRLPVVFELR